MEKLNNRKLSTIFLITMAAIMLVLTGCSKNKNNTANSDLPTAKSLITANFDKSLASGKFTQTVKSDEMKQSSKLDGTFKGSALVNLNYSLTSKGKTQGEQMWLTPDNLYLLLEQNKGRWIKNKATADNFDPEQVTHRFKPETFKKINKIMAKNGIVRQTSNNYTVTLSGGDDAAWEAINGLIVDDLNTPGSQNMNVAQMVSAAQPQNMQIIYTINKQSKMITKITMKTTFTAGGKYKFNWDLTYDELNHHDDLAIPANIQKDAIDVQKVKEAAKK